MSYPQRTQGGNDRHRDSPPPIKLDDVKFGKEIDAGLFNEIAQCMARAIFEDGHWAKKKESWKRETNLGRNKSTQLRKFYDELVMWH
ncbi:MAG: hypothetical protein LBE85_08650, partial [Candidatus Accumulibacter sp.]|nr:hypothetical protein [Accumulibacter sp.]